MWQTIFLSVIMAGGLGAIVFLVWRRLPDLRGLDVSSIAAENQGKAKNKILYDKFVRQGKEASVKIRALLVPAKNFFSLKFKKVKDLISELEEKYQKYEKDENGRPQTSAEALAEAKEFLNKKKSAEAEKKLIEVIYLDKINIRAFELLGDLYFEQKNYSQAEEVYRHLIKLTLLKGKGQNQNIKAGKLEEMETQALTAMDTSTKLAVYYDDLAQVCEMTDKKVKALESYLKASAIEPNNPKYLDKLIALSIETKDRGLARRTLNRLRQINPDNAKLNDFQAAIEKI